METEREREREGGERGGEREGGERHRDRQNGRKIQRESELEKKDRACHFNHYNTIGRYTAQWYVMLQYGRSVFRHQQCALLNKVLVTIIYSAYTAFMAAE